MNKQILEILKEKGLCDDVILHHICPNLVKLHYKDVLSELLIKTKSIHEWLTNWSNCLMNLDRYDHVIYKIHKYRGKYGIYYRCKTEVLYDDYYYLMKIYNLEKHVSIKRYRYSQYSQSNHYKDAQPEIFRRYYRQYFC